MLRIFRQSLLVLAFLVVSTFLIVRLVPGDPVRRAAGLDATDEEIETTRHLLGLDRPILSQFGDYVSDLARFEMGSSLISKESVESIIAARLPNTLLLAGTAMGVVLVGSVALGISAAVLTRDNRHPRLEVLYTGVTSLMGGIPAYLSAAVLIVVFALWQAWLPAGGSDGLKTLILPVLAISVSSAASLSRIVRVEALNVLKQNYIRVARSKRLPNLHLYSRHVLPNVLTGVLTIGGVILKALIGSAVIVEAIFAWPGLGTTVVNAILSRDFPVIQGAVLVLGVIVLVINTLIDLTIQALVPKAEL